MLLEKGNLYHIYNQGNNQRKIFFKKENYTFFIEKIKIHLLPYVDLLAYCLMPNHFHLMVLVREEELPIQDTHTVTQSHGVSKNRTINDSIGILLRSYTRAINKQENFSGKLFREKTKAECINCFKRITPSFINDKKATNNLISEKQYPQICFNYIHQNPVKAGILENEVDYEFSSAKDYAGLRDDVMINKEVAFEYIDFKTDASMSSTPTNIQGLTLSESLTKNKNPELELALNFVEKTDRNIFLTGKAGTGKTTFLHQIKEQSLKRLVVVAPTGVAAINAKGVTIHSFFQMPFGPIIPGVEKKSKYRFNKTKIDIIRSLDLLIIDEISMVRADLLDGIDQVLRRYKSRNKVFGGVQVLMIGDLQQLSPVVKPYEWDLLKTHYDNAFFFSAHAFQKSDAISIELKHIYRQQDEQFIAILNEVRNDSLRPESAKILNERYQPEFVPPKDSGYITLTTHNNRANTINEKELNKLKNKSYFYKAAIEGKFNEYAYPTHESLELKEGSQVMFIKNDSSGEKRYYNGKIGKITYLDNDSITVECPDDTEEINVTQEVWENVSYTINDETKKIEEKISGSFSQIPLRLAWAITIHKSQGLTFEKAIIDAEASFAHGQTYVALSRCKSLEGIVLKTKIRDHSIISDSKVDSFTKEVEQNQPDGTILSASQKQYQLNLIQELFNYYEFIFPLKRIIDIYYQNKSSIEGNLIEIIPNLKDNVSNLLKVSTSFKQQLEELSDNTDTIEGDKKVQERIGKGIAYYIEFTETKIKIPFETVNFTTDNTQIKKDLHKQFDCIEDLISYKIYCLLGLKENFTLKKYLELRAKAVLEKSDKSTHKSRNKRVEITSTKHSKLFEDLRELRHVLAHSENLSHYQIFTQKSLYEMCEYLPSTPQKLKKINGMGKVRVKKYGEEILEIINAYATGEGLESTAIKYEKSKDSNEIETPTKKKIDTKQASLELFQSGKTIEEIAKERGFVKSTIEGHLAHFIPTGEIKITDLISEKKYKELKKIMKKMKYESFSELKEKIDDKFTYSELRLVSMEFNQE